MRIRKAGHTGMYFLESFSEEEILLLQKISQENYLDCKAWLRNTASSVLFEEADEKPTIDWIYKTVDYPIKGANRRYEERHFSPN